MSNNPKFRIVAAIIIGLLAITAISKDAALSAAALTVSALLVLPYTSALFTEKINIKSKVKKWSAIFLLVFGLILLRGELPKTAKANKTENVVPVKENLVSITAPDLLQSYHANEVAADQRFKGKTILVTGIVESINKDFMDDIYIVLQGDGYFMNVHCSFENENVAANLSKGEQITLKGKCEGMIVGSVSMKDCTLAP